MSEPTEPPPKSRIRKRCITCNIYYTVPKSWDDRHHNCSVRCRDRARQIKNQKASAKAMSQAAVLAENHRLTPGDSALIRGAIAAYVQNHIGLADRVVSGEVVWSPTQARVFSTLLNKVVPDLSASYVQHEHSQKSLIDLSREELERIAAGLDEVDLATDIIDVTPTK